MTSIEADAEAILESRSRKSAMRLSGKTARHLSHLCMLAGVVILDRFLGSLVVPGKGHALSKHSRSSVYL